MYYLKMKIYYLTMLVRAHSCVCVTIVLLISRETVYVSVVFVSEILCIVVAGHPVFDSE